MVVYTKPQQGKKEESERLRGERDQIKFIDLRYKERKFVVIVYFIVRFGRSKRGRAGKLRRRSIKCNSLVKRVRTVSVIETIEVRKVEIVYSLQESRLLLASLHI